jgi:drug/metabolite transporter (DMT)-like permease
MGVDVRVGRSSAALKLLLVAVLFGGTWPAGKVAVDHVPPLTVATARFVLASILLVALVRLREGRVPLPARRDLPLVLALGLTGIAAYQAFFLIGLVRTPASDGAILVPGLIPVFTTLLAWRVLGQRPTRRIALGFAIAIAGLIVVVDPAGELSRSRLVGDLILVGAAVCWAVYTILGRSATVRFDALLATTYASVVGTLMLLPFSVTGWGTLAHAGAAAWASILYLAPLGTVLAFVLYYDGVRKLGAAKAAAYTLLVPVFGVSSSIIVLGEPLRPGLVVGGLIVLAGLWLVQRPARQAPAVAVPASHEAHSRA